MLKIISNKASLLLVCFTLILSGCGKKKIVNENNYTQEIDREQKSTNSIKLIREFQDYIHEKILFNFDDDEISEEMKRKLDKQIEWIISHPELNNIIIEGHCDQVGSREYNISLGERRAESVRRYMIDKGISHDILSTASHGKDKPEIFGSSDEINAQNRRCLTIIK